MVLHFLLLSNIPLHGHIVLHLFIVETFGLFVLFLAIMNDAAVNFHVQGFV